MASSVWLGIWLPLLASLVGVASPAYVDQGFLLTTPKVLTAGTTERFCVTFYNLDDSAHLAVHLLPKQNSTVAQSLMRFSRTFDASGIGQKSSCFDVPIPRKITQTRPYLRASVLSGFFASTKTSPISLMPFALVTLVQTDKTKYKAGQLVQFRVVTLKSDLTALEEVVDQIFITTPGNTRLAQFDKVATKSGIIQKTFQLTNEPPLGKWTIHVKRGDSFTRQTFEVDEFVLPRFEVKITGPKFIVRRANTVTLKVCADYTFGKPVTSAAVKMRVKRSGRFFRRGNKDVPNNVTITEQTGKDGCVEVDVLMVKIGLGPSSRQYSSRVYVEANVTESGTGLTESGDVSIPIQNPSLRVTVDKRASTFIKPKLEYIGYATIKDTDNKPVEKHIVEVCYTATSRGKRDNAIIPGFRSSPDGGAALASPSFRRLPIIIPPDPGNTISSRVCREYTSDENGRIKYRIPGLDLGLLRVSINMRPKRTGIGTSSGYHNLRVWFSPTNSFISVDPVTDPFDLKCSGFLDMKITTTFPRSNKQITYMIMTRGQIIRMGLVGADGIIKIPLAFDVSPVFKILVYHVNTQGEIVSDSKTFEVAKCFQNQVRVSWDRKQVQPGETATFTVKGAPNSLCGVSAVDRSVELLSSANKLTAESVFSKLQRFVIPTYAHPRLVKSPNEYCKRKPLFARPSFFEAISFPAQPPVAPEDDRPGRIVPPPQRREFYYVVHEDDAIKAFDVAGYLPLTNLVLETRPCERRNRTVCRRCVVPFARGGGAIRFASANSSVVPGTSLHRKTDVVVSSVSSTAAPAPAALEQTVRSFFPETFLFQLEALGSAQSAASPAPAALEQTVRSFFPETFLFQLEVLGADGETDVTRKMPDTITSWVGSAFCSNLKRGFGLSETASITTFKPFFAQINVPFSVKRGELLRLKVSVFNFLPGDLSVLAKLTPSKDFVLDGGAPATHTVCVRSNKPSVVEYPLQFKSLGKVDITVTISTAGSACGKPNAVQASDAIRRNVLIKPEGFPQEDVSTAFLCQPKGATAAIVETHPLPLPATLVPDSQRAWIGVVGDLIAPSAENLERMVQVPRGCGEQNMITFVPNILVRRYLETVKLITEALKTRTANNMRTGYQRELTYRRSDGSYSAFKERSPPVRKGSLWLTAFVVRSYVAASRYIAIDTADLDVSTKWIVRLQEASGAFKRHGALFHREMRGGVEFGGQEALTAYVVLTLLEAGGHQAAVDKALTYLLASTKLGTLYSEVLVAHALVQAGRPEGAQRVDALLKRGVRRGGQLHWAGDRSSSVGGSRAVDVEMTAYMVLSLLKLGGSKRLSEAALAAKWINAQRNGVGGFVSTQDTVVALSALTEFAISTYSPDVSADVTASAQGGFSERVSVTGGTRLLTRQKTIPALQLPNAVKFEVTGEGCCVVQTVFRYNTKTAFPDPSFNLKAELLGTSCSRFTLHVCTSFKKPNIESNMAIVEIEMISGFVSVDRSLKNLVKDGVIEKWEFKDDKASLYFDKFTTKEVCFDVRFIQALEVEKLKPAVVRVYDYYAVEDKFEVEYGPPCKK